MSIKPAKAMVELFVDDLIVYNIDLADTPTVREVTAHAINTMSNTIAEKNVLGGLVVSNGLSAIVKKVHILGELFSEEVYGLNDVNTDANLASKILTTLPNNVAHLALVSNGKGNDTLLGAVRNIMPPKGVIFTVGDVESPAYMNLTVEEVNSIPILQNALNPAKADGNLPKVKVQFGNDLPKAEKEAEWLPKAEWLPIDPKIKDAKEDALQIFDAALKMLEEKKAEKKAEKKVANPDLVKKLKVALGQEEEEPEFIPIEDAIEPAPEIPKNPAVLAAYEKMMAFKKAKEEQKKKDAEAQNPARQLEIRSKLAEILRQKQEKEEERKKLIALEAKMALEEQRQKVGNLFAIPKEGEFNGFKFNPVLEQNDNDAETAQALEHLKKIDEADPKNKKKPKLDPIEEAKKLAEELKQKKLLESLKEKEAANAAEVAAAAEAKKKKKKKSIEEISAAADEANNLLNALSGNNNKGNAKTKIVKASVAFDELF